MAHNEASHVSFESSSSAFPNQLSVERTARPACDWAELLPTPRLRRELWAGLPPALPDPVLGVAPRAAADVEAPDPIPEPEPEAEPPAILALELLRRKPSMAVPRMVASTILALVASAQLFCLARGFNFGLPESPPNGSFFCNRSRTSLDRATAELLLRTLFFRAIGWWRFANHPDKAADPLSCASVTSCLALFSKDTSKLLERVERPAFGSNNPLLPPAPLLHPPA